MFLKLDIDEVENVDILKYLCSLLDNKIESLEEDLLDSENVLYTYRGCIREITGVLQTFNFSKPDPAYACDVLHTILQTLQDFNLRNI